MADRMTTSDLVVQLSDDFERDYGPPDHYDTTRWAKWKGDARTADGRCVLSTTSPGEYGTAGIVARERFFNPGLAGTNGVEVTLEGFTPEGGDPGGLEKREEMGLVQAWGITLGSAHGAIGEPIDRAVQMHFDLLRPNGLFVYLVRGLLPEDFEKYPRDGYGSGAPEGLTDLEKRQLHEDAVERGEVFISVPCLQLINRVYRSEPEIQDFVGRSRRWGLYLTDDGNTVYWTLDGQVMDHVDIAGYFSSSPESVRDGAFVTIGGFGIGSWRLDDVVIRASPQGNPQKR